MKDAVATMGNILPDDAGGRDAVHVAVFSAFSDIVCYPGDRVSIVERGERDTKVRTSGPGIAIVDPFLSDSVKPGERFWAYLLPRTITALSHHWSHPSFGEADTSYVTPSAKLASEQWLKDFSARAGSPCYENLILGITSAVDGGGCASWGEDGYYRTTIESNYLFFGGTDASGEIPPEFWGHVENVIGRKVPHRPNYFSCSC